jgi:hypothetical protein
MKTRPLACVLLVALTACGPNTSTPFKLLTTADLTPTGLVDFDGIFGLVANDDLVVVGRRRGQLLVFDGNQAFDTTRPLEEQVLSFVDLDDTKGSGCLAMQGSTVYAGLAGNKLKVISLADPKKPVITDSLLIIPLTEVATLNSHFLFVSSRVRTQAIDLSTSPPTVVARELPLTSVLALAASETHLYSTDMARADAIEVWALDAKGGATHEQTVSITPRITALTVHGTTLYAANAGVLALFDLSSPDGPRAINPKPGVVSHSQSWNRGQGMQGVAVMGRERAVGPGHGPVFYDLSKPEAVVGATGDDIQLQGGDLEMQNYAAATRSRFWTAGETKVFVFGRE